MLPLALWSFGWQLSILVPLFLIWTELRSQRRG
jgi:hypothetical protein